MNAITIVQSIDSNPSLIGRAVQRHFDVIWRELTRSQGSEDRERWFRIITGELHPLGNLAILSEPNDPTLLAEAAEPLYRLDAPSAVVFVAGVSPAIAQQLGSHGYAQHLMPAMAVDTQTLTDTTLEEGYEFFRVTTDAEGTEWTDVITSGFELPRGLARILSPEVHGVNGNHDATVQFFGIRKGSKVVATSMLYLTQGLAGIYCVATLREERGKGLGAHVTAEALRVAHQIGYRVGVLQSSEAGHSVYLGLGFRDVGSMPMFIRVPASDLTGTSEANAA